MVTALFMVFTMIPPVSYAAETSPSTSSNAVTSIDGISISYEGMMDESLSTEAEYWFTALDESAETPTVTKVNLTNTNEEDGYLSFDYSVGSISGDNTFGSVKSSDGYIDVSGSINVENCGKIDYPGEGKEAIIKSGETLTITLTSANVESWVDSVFVLYKDGFVFDKIYTEADVTFETPENGSYTVNGENKAGSTVTAEVDASGNWPSYKLVATANSGYQFLQWVDGNGNFVSSDAEYTLVPSNGDMSIRPVFAAKSDAQFKVGNMKYDNWGKAMEAATNSEDKVVTLMNNATLAAGTYTIPEGVTFVVPFDAEGTVYRDKPECITHNEDGSESTWIKPSAYRTLTLEKGANIVVNGELSIPSPHTPARGSKENGSSPHMAYGEIAMADGSNITINDGGAIYAYGYVTGEGTVDAKSGATIYEYFQIMDFKGGSATTHMLTGGYLDEETGESVFCRILPLSQYYVQNIEVPLTINYGAQEYGYSSVFMGQQLISSPVGFIGNGEDMMFKLKSGSVTKSYDGDKDRLVAEVNGEIMISPMTIKQYQYTVDSGTFVLPINNNITINVNSGSKVDITQDIALLPGAELIVDAGATCDVKSKVYVYDRDQWLAGNYVSSNRTQLEPLNYAPGMKEVRTVAGLVDAKIQVAGTLDASKGYVYTTEAGANIGGVDGGVIKLQQGGETYTWQFEYIGAAEVDIDYGNYDKIPITNAKLVNGDGTYYATKLMNGTYTYTDGAWIGECNHSYKAVSEEDGGVVAPTCGDKGYTIYKCSYCPAKEHRDFVDATGLHTPGSEATCTTAQVCTVCNNTIVEALDHSWNEGVVTENATCVSDGVKTFTCTRDNCNATKTETIKATGHTEGPAATCTESQNCTVCGDVLVAAKGHTNEIIPAEAPTCTKTGLTAGVKCSVCDEILTAQEEVPVIEHPWDEGVIKAGDEATCTVDGVKTYTCTVCDATKEETIKAAHKWDETDKAPTCTEAGAGATCSVCGETTEEVDALGHLFTKYEVTKDDKAATCSQTGTETAVCDRGCGETHTRDTAKLAHTEEAVAAVAATCTKTGLTAGTKCSVCDEPIVAQTETPKLNHSETSVAAKAATCIETGLTEGKKCIVCGEFTVEQQKTDALNHPENEREIVPETPAKCGETGLSQAEKCKLCGEFTIPQFTLPALEHDMADATCTEPKTCKHGCGYTEGEAVGHSLIELEAEAAFCEQSGYEAGTQCVICKEIFGHEEIPALGHDWKTIEAKAPTYSNKGWNEHQQCQRCKKKEGYEEYDQLGAYINSYDEFVENLAILEDWALDYIKENPGKDPLNLVIKYIRTGVDRYNSGSWNIMAGYEDEGFANYVAAREDEHNSTVAAEDMIKVTGLKDIKEFALPSGEVVDFGHMFGTMDITYHHSFRVDNADVGGWAGDIVDLLSLADFCGTGGAKTIDDMADYINEFFMGKERGELAEEGLVPNPEEDEDDNIVEGHYNEGVFSDTDVSGDLDAYYIMKNLEGSEYETGDLTALFKSYFTADLSMAQRAAYLIANRLDDATLRQDLRNEVYHAYTANSSIGTLEGTRDWKNSGDDLMNLRKAACYAFADYLCKLAGDYVAELENDYIEVISSERSTLAPGITQTLYKGTSADGKNMSYYIATCDVTRDDVNVYANYSTRPVEKDEDGNYKWNMMRVLEQAENAQNKYGDPENEEYIPNFNVVAAINAGGYDMSDGTPGGLLVMDSIEYYPVDGDGFFGILEDGSAVIGTEKDYKELSKDGKVKEAIGGFGTTLVKDGKVSITRNEDYYTERASRTAVGITKTGKVVFMVLDGRMGGDTIDDSCGGSMEEIAQIMLDAGCVHAINLDGGGSSTFVSKEEGSTKLAVTNKPSDGAPRSISTSLFVASTAPSSTEFDHAVIESEYSYMTVGSSIKLEATGVSATNNVVDMPEGTTWTTSNTLTGKIAEDGTFTAERTGSVDIKLMLGDEVVGSKTINVVKPDNLYYTKDTVNAVHGKPIELPIKAVYNNKPVAITAKDITFSLSDNRAGTIDGFIFTPAATDLKNVKITAALPDTSAAAIMTAYLYSPDEASFDFENATAGDEQFSWKREISADMSTTYSFGIDMSKIDVPERLEPLTYMLPGADMDNASAWTFLCNLAERMSDQTYVKAKVQFDSNVDVDISGLTLVNDYFMLDKENDVEFDEETNTATITLRWKKQSKPINVDMANPICILSGIKITPKADAAWTNDKLEIVNKGEVSYRVYMRASGLYTFSSKPENQKEFGLYDYVHPKNDAERGGWFESIYNTFKDEYTLDKSIKNGWVMGDGGWRYYVDGKPLTGIQNIGGYYYEFDKDTGLNKGQELYTGEYTKNGKEFYINKGLIFTGVKGDGWHMMNNGEFRYYNPKADADGDVGVRLKVTANEHPSTCIIDGYCDYTAANGATYHQPYDDAGGHEYKTQADGKVICTECGWQQLAMSECNIKLSATKVTYSGKPLTVSTTITNPVTGEKLTKSVEYADYHTQYYDNTNVGVARAVVTANKYGIYSDLRTWRGNYRESHTMYYTILPASPTNVKYTISKKNYATVTWTKTDSAQKYRVQYSTNGGKSWKTAKTTTNGKYTMKLNKKYKYMFRVKSIGTGLDQNGKTQTYESLKYATAKLKTVSNLKATNVLISGKPKISWSKVKGASKYSIYRSTSEDGTYTKLYTTKKNYYTDNKAKVGTKYYYKVVTVHPKNSAANSVLSNDVAKICKLKRPFIKLSNKSKGKIKVTWKKVSGASKYEVYRKASGGKWKKVKTTTTTSWINKSGLKKGKTYYYKVKAIKADNTVANSAYSAYKKIKRR